MAFLTCQCDSCGKEIEASVSQSVTGDRLVWYFSYQCSFCGAVVEGDDVGIPPDKVRKALLDEGGEWHLVVSEPLPNRSRIMQVLRQTANLSLAEASERSKLIPGKVALGTQPEMEWLKRQFTSKGLNASVEKSH